MLKKILTIITLLTIYTLHATPVTNDAPNIDTNGTTDTNSSYTTTGGTIEDELYTITYEYDSLNRVTKAIYEGSKSITYTYDAGGNLLTVEVQEVDSDGDGYPDSTDAFPNNVNEWADTDGDNIGDNADTDDDNDGLSDTQEETLGTNTTNPDTDGDGVKDSEDAFPLDANESKDSDGDNIGDNAEPSNPDRVDAYLDIYDNMVHVSWSKVTRAKGYKLYVNDNLIQTITSDTHDDEHIYQYYSLKNASQYSGTVEVKVVTYNEYDSSEGTITYFKAFQNIALHTPLQDSWHEWRKGFSSRVYSFQLTKATKVTIDLEANRTLSSNYLELYAKGTHGVVDYTNIDKTYTSQYSKTRQLIANLEAGIYYIKANSHLGKLTSFTLTVTTSSVENISPIAPKGVHASNILSDSFILNWSNAMLEDGYNVYTHNNQNFNGSSSINSHTSLITSREKNIQDYKISGLNNNSSQHYSYGVSAFNKQGESNGTFMSVALATKLPLNTLVHSEIVYPSKKHYEITLTKPLHITLSWEKIGHGAVSTHLIPIDNQGIYAPSKNWINMTNGDTFSLETGKYIIELDSYDFSDVDKYSLALYTHEDTDGDGILNREDTDDDNDGILDENDVFPLDANESVDTDGDNIGDNADNDDDNDGLTDQEELELGTNSTNPDTDNDGHNDANDTYPTDPTQWEEVTITIVPLEEIYILSNTALPTITIDANASNKGNLTYSVASNQPNILTATMSQNLLTLTSLTTEPSDVNITITVTQGTKSETITSTIHIRPSLILLEEEQSGTYKPLDTTHYSYEVNHTHHEVNITPHGTVNYTVTHNSKKTILHLNIANIKVKIDHQHTAKVILPTQKEVHMTITSNGSITPHIEGATLPKKPLGLGSTIESDGKKVRFTIPMSEKLTF